MSFFNWECAYSGKYLGGKTKDRSIDHVIPLNSGGENEIWNCIPMDRSLNSSKNDKEMLDTNSINAIAKGPDNLLIVATKGGIILINEEDETFKRLNKENISRVYNEEVLDVYYSNIT